MKSPVVPRIFPVNNLPEHPQANSLYLMRNAIDNTICDAYFTTNTGDYVKIIDKQRINEIVNQAIEQADSEVTDFALIYEVSKL